MTIEIPEQRADFANLVQRHPADHDAERQDDGHGPDGGTTVIGGILPHGGLGHQRAGALPPPDPDPGGRLPRNSSRSKQSRELLIFLTPRIIK